MGQVTPLLRGQLGSTALLFSRALSPIHHRTRRQGACTQLPATQSPHYCRHLQGNVSPNKFRYTHHRIPLHHTNSAWLQQRHNEYVQSGPEKRAQTFPLLNMTIRHVKAVIKCGNRFSRRSAGLISMSEASSAIAHRSRTGCVTLRSGAAGACAGAAGSRLMSAPAGLGAAGVA